MLYHLIQMPWQLAYQFGDAVKLGCFAGCFPHSQNQPYNSPSQICIAGRMHFSVKNSNDMFFSNWNKKPDKEKFIVEPIFFTSWTMTSKECTRAHLQENKSRYLSLYLSIWKRFWKRVYISSGFTSNHRLIATELFRMVQGPHSSGQFWRLNCWNWKADS